MNKSVLEALTHLLPEDKVKELTPAIEAAFEEAKTELETEFNKNLEEAYAQLATEKTEAEEIAEQGYQEAYSIIQDLRGRLETQQAEFNTAMEEGYEEAYQALLSERAKKEELQTEIYEEYDKKLAEMKEYMVDKIHEFFQHKTAELRNEVRREILNDPQVAEHKVALDKVVGILSDYITDDQYQLAANNKLEQALQVLEDMRNQKRILEARNVNLARENKKINEQYKVLQEQVKTGSEQTLTEARKEKQEKAAKATGSGEKVTKDEIKVIKEHNAEVPQQPSDDETLSESFDAALMDQMKVLAGVKPKNNQ
jgi:hypothetical protein